METTSSLEQEKQECLAEYEKQCRIEDEQEDRRAEEIKQVEELDKSAERQHPVCFGCGKVWCECIRPEESET